MGRGEGLSWEVGIVAVYSQGLWWNSTATVSHACSAAEAESRHSSAALALLGHSGTSGFIWTSVSSCALGWVRRWAGGMSSSHWLRTGYWKLLKDLMWPSGCVFICCFISVKAASSTGSLWLEVPEFPLLQKHWAVILSYTVTAKPLCL